MCLFEVDKTSVDIIGVLPRFLENFLENENWLVVLRPGRYRSFGSIISGTWHTIFQHPPYPTALFLSHTCSCHCVSGNQ